MLNYRTIGTGKNLVLLHGFGFSSGIFQTLIDKYKNQYAITAIDLPGHGSSADHKCDEWIPEIIKILPPKPILLGWSLGGLLAIKIANLIKVDKLILVATTPKFVTDAEWKFGISPHNFKVFNDSLKNNTSNALTRFVSLQGIDKTTNKKLKTIIENNTPTISGMECGMNILLNSNLIKFLIKLKNIEVVLGEFDTLVPVEIANWYQQYNIKTTIIRTGHLPFLVDKFNID